MSTDLSDPSRWYTWCGNELVGAGTGEPALPCLHNDGMSTWQRHATHRHFAGKITFTGWFEWLENTEPAGPGYLGIHLGLLQDNDHGYHVSLKPGIASLLCEYKEPLKAGSTYSRLCPDVESTILPGLDQRYQFRVVFSLDGIEAEVNMPGRDNEVVLREDGGAHWRFPRMHSGRVALRLDRQVVNLGSLVVTEEAL